MDALTSKDYWEQGYRQRRDAVTLPDLTDFRELPARLQELADNPRRHDAGKLRGEEGVYRVR